jgi:hypothetical protein
MTDEEFAAANLNPDMAQIVEMAKARRNGLIRGLPKVVGVGDSLADDFIALTTIYVQDFRVAGVPSVPA